MVFTTRTKSSSSTSTGESWGMGFLLVFFPEEDDHTNPDSKKKPDQSLINLFSLRRTNSSHLLQKAQSTISICLLLVFATVLLFTLSTLPPSSTASASARRFYRVPRRHLSSPLPEPSYPNSNFSHALQGMGTLYRRGTRAMSELVVAHATESLTQPELALFLRLFHRSSLASKSDLVFIFPSKTASFDRAIVRENDSFFKLLTELTQHKHKPSNDSASFDVAQFTKLSKKERGSGEPIWGRRIRTNSSEEGETESNRPSYGSVLGFDVEELDPENSLSGFLDHVPMSLRRWACYPMLLGRVRRNFKHVMLLDVKEFLILSDPLARVRGQTPESVLLKATTQPSPGKHGKKNPDKTQSTRQKTVHPGIIMGGSRGVRRLSNAMLTDIVRGSMQHKKKSPISDSALFNQLVGNDFVLRNVNVIVSGESVPEVSSLGGSKSVFAKSGSLIRRGNSNLDVVNAVVMKHLCSFTVDSRVYSDYC